MTDTDIIETAQHIVAQIRSLGATADERDAIFAIAREITWLDQKRRWEGELKAKIEAEAIQ